MANQFTGSTFSGTYKDDFLDSAGYHKILFNSGRALQGRELNQLQTILQRQITRMANNLFMDGAAVSPKSSGAGTDIVDYVIVERLFVPDEDYIGAVFRGEAGIGTGGLVFQVSHIEPAPDIDANLNAKALYGRYLSAGQEVTNSDVQTSFLTFNDQEKLTNISHSGAGLLASVYVRTQPAPSSTQSTGKGVLFSMQRADFYTQGHFVHVSKQTIAISKFTNYADAQVGFQVKQDIVTTADDDALYDNQGTRPNLSSPGADRYRIRMILATRESVPDEEDFVTFATVRASKIIQIKEGTDNFNQNESRMAKRHFDTHGNFIVNDFDIQFNDADDINSLLYEVPAVQNGVAPIAFLDGYRLQHQIPAQFVIPKPLTYVAEQAQKLEVGYKNYISLGYDTRDINLSQLDFGNATDAPGSRYSVNHSIDLIDSDGVDGLGGNVVGTAHLKTLVSTGRLDSDAYRVYLKDISMDPGKNFRLVRKLRSSTGDGSVSSLNALMHLDTPLDGIIPTNLGGNSLGHNGNLYITEPQINTSLFRVPGGRVKSLIPTKIPVQRMAQQEIVAGTDADANAILKLTLTCFSGESFIDTANWIIINNTTSAVIDIPFADIDTSAANNVIITVPSANGVVATDICQIIYYVEKSGETGLSPKTKTYTEAWAPFTRTAGEDTFKAEIAGYSTLFDGIELVKARERGIWISGHPDWIDNSGFGPTSEEHDTYESFMGPEVTHQLTFDGGQRDNFYGPIQIKADGVQDHVLVIYAKVAYFTHSATGDYFSANSYVLDDEFAYADIPSFTSKSTGEFFQLHDCIDFRGTKSKNLTSALLGSTLEIPRDGGLIEYDVEFYNSRVDHVALTYDESFKPQIVINQGEESQNVVSPGEVQNQMVLFDILLPGNTKGATDIMFNRREYRGYQMSDIEAISRRVSRVEETTSLNALENEASNLVELAPDGTLRSKTGLFVDDFAKGMALTASTIGNDFLDDPSFATSSYDEDTNTVHGKLALESIGFQYDVAGDKIGIRGAGVSGLPSNSGLVVKTENLLLEYDHVCDPSMKQEMISWKSGDDAEEHGYYNVNPFNVFLGEGMLRLRPASDTWFDQRRLPDLHTNASPIYKQIGEKLVPRTITMTRTATRTWILARGRRIPRGRHGVFEEQTMRTQTVVGVATLSQAVENEFVSSQSSTIKTGERRVAVLSIPFMRQKRVFASAEGLRPNTRYWPFMRGINMSQWCIDLGKTAHASALLAGKHRTALAPTNVNMVRCPGTITSGINANQKLITDANGELYFQLWIPNTARVSVPNSTQFNTQQEWQKWQNNQKRYASTYGANSAAAMNANGWKFRCGTAPIKLLDISVNNESDALSLARTTFTSTGSVNVMQSSFLTTRTISYKNVFGEADVTGSVTTTNNDWVRWVPRDPLAQTFTVDGGEGVPGVFVTKIDIFLHKAPRTATNGGQDLSIPLQLQLRPVIAGVPDREIVSEQHSVYKTADECWSAINGQTQTLAKNQGGPLEHPVTFEFKEPVYLRSGDEYAFVLLAETDNYEAYVASTYDLILGSTSKRVNKQPANGSLFLSQNGSTWTPKQNQDMAYRIYTAKFKSEGRANFYSNPIEKHRHNYDTSLSVDTSNLNRFRVSHQGHGLGVGDKVGMEGLPNFADNLEGDASKYYGVLGRSIINSTNVVEDPDVNGYYVTLDSAFDAQSGTFGSTSLETNRGFPIDVAVLNYQDLLVEETTIKYTSNFISGFSHSNGALSGSQDLRFTEDPSDTIMQNGTNLFFDTPKYVGNLNQEWYSIAPLNDSAASIVISAEFSSTQTSTFGDPTPAQTASGYVSDVSPMIDMQSINMLLVNNVVDNQVLADIDNADTALGGRNKPANFVPETAPLSGTSASKHITKVVTLKQAAKGLRILVDAYKPPAADLDLYYRVGTELDDNLYERDWVLLPSQNTPPSALRNAEVEQMTFAEYRYLAGIGQTSTSADLDDFVTFQVKVVLRTTNTCESPVINSIRAIALI
mgnify:CR=1 FL=1